jgi:hypothetical protein
MAVMGARMVTDMAMGAAVTVTVMATRQQRTATAMRRLLATATARRMWVMAIGIMATDTTGIGQATAMAIGSATAMGTGWATAQQGLGMAAIA